MSINSILNNQSVEQQASLKDSKFSIASIGNDSASNGLVFPQNSVMNSSKSINQQSAQGQSIGGIESNHENSNFLVLKMPDQSNQFALKDSSFNQKPNDSRNSGLILNNNSLKNDEDHFGQLQSKNDNDEDHFGQLQSKNSHPESNAFKQINSGLSKKQQMFGVLQIKGSKLESNIQSKKQNRINSKIDSRKGSAFGSRKGSAFGSRKGTALQSNKDISGGSQIMQHQSKLSSEPNSSIQHKQIIIEDQSLPFINHQSQMKPESKASLINQLKTQNLNNSRQESSQMNDSKHSSIKGSANAIISNEQAQSNLSLVQGELRGDLNEQLIGSINNSRRQSKPMSKLKDDQKNQHQSSLQYESQQAMGQILASQQYEYLDKGKFSPTSSHFVHQNQSQNKQHQSFVMNNSIAQNSIPNLGKSHNSSLFNQKLNQSILSHKNTVKGSQKHTSKINDSSMEPNQASSLHQEQRPKTNSRLSSKVNQQSAPPSLIKSHDSSLVNQAQVSQKEDKQQSVISIGNHINTQSGSLQMQRLSPLQLATLTKNDSLNYTVSKNDPTSSRNNMPKSRNQISSSYPYPTQQQYPYPTQHSYPYPTNQSIGSNLVSHSSKSIQKNNQETRYQEQLESNHESETVVVEVHVVDRQSEEPINMKKYRGSKVSSQDQSVDQREVDEEIYRSRKGSDYNERILQSQDFGTQKQPLPRKRVETEFDMKEHSRGKFTQLKPHNHQQSACIFQTEIYPTNMSIANSKLAKIRQVKQFKKKKLEDQLAKLSQQIQSLTKKQHQIQKFASPAKNFNERLKIDTNTQARQKAISMVKNLQKDRKARQIEKISSIDKIDHRIHDYMSELAKVRVQNQVKIKQKRQLQIIQRMKTKEMHKIKQIKKIQASSKFVSQFTKDHQHKLSKPQLLSPRPSNRDLISPESTRKRSQKEDFEEGLTPELANKKAYLNRVRNLSRKKEPNHHQEKGNLYENKLH